MYCHDWGCMFVGYIRNSDHNPIKATWESWDCLEALLAIISGQLLNRYPKRKKS
jgi:hypothetical protein